MLAVAPARAQAEDVVVFAASSLKTALDEIAAEFAGPPVTGLRSPMPGRQLARQILLGAPADVFLSANTAWMDELEAEGGSRRARGATCSATAWC